MMISRRKTLRWGIGLGLAKIAALPTFAKSTKRSANDTPTPPDGQNFFFEHWSIGKVRNPAVPLVVGSSITPYADLALAQGFHVGRLEGKRLVYMENWDRVRRNVPLETLIGDRPLSDFEVALPTADLSSQTPLFFQQLAGPDDVWTEVPVDQTVGTSVFIRLRIIKVEETFKHIAEHVQQRLERKSEYFYDASGAHIKSIYYGRENDYEPIAYPTGRTD